jgi:hypothetical protein
MNTSEQPIYTGTGLDCSGYSVSLVQAGAEVISYVNDSGLVCVRLPGHPCEVLLVLDVAGMEMVVEHLDMRSRELRARYGKGVH